MKVNEVVVGQSYLFLDKGRYEHKVPYHNQVGKVVKRIKGKSHKNAFHRNRRGKGPDKFLLDIGVYAGAADLEPLNT